MTNKKTILNKYSKIYDNLYYNGSYNTSEMSFMIGSVIEEWVTNGPERLKEFLIGNREWYYVNQ